MAKHLVGTKKVHVPRQGPGGVEVEAAHHVGPQPAPGLRRRVLGDQRRGYGLGGHPFVSSISPSYRWRRSEVAQSGVTLPVPQCSSPGLLEVAVQATSNPV